MGQIRSALDIALEKTADIISDKTGAHTREMKNTGKRLAGDFLSTSEAEALTRELEKHSPEDRKLITEGALSVLRASIRLPSLESDLDKTIRAGNCIALLLPGSGMEEMFQQVTQIFSQYMAERDNLEKALEQQFMPRLRAKQQEMAKRYGQNIPIDLRQDPEYMAALSKNKRMLEQKYEQIVTEIRARVQEAAGITEE